METGKEMVIRDDFTPFVLMDKLDDELIVQELEGRMPEVLTYHFSDKGNEVWGLSKAGVDEAKAELSKKGECLRVLDYQFIDGQEDAYFVVKVGRYVVNKDGREILLDSNLGSKRQPKKTVSGKDNPFWFEQGITKAQRNGFHSLIPKAIVNGVIEYAKQQGKVKEVKPNGNKPQEQEKPQETTGDASIIESGITSVTMKQDKSKAGKPYTLYTIHIGEEKYTTFDKKIAEDAKIAYQNGLKARIEFRTTKFGKDILHLQVEEPPEEQ